MRFLHASLQILLLIGISETLVLGADEDYRVYTEQPRLLLNAKRLRLLRREKERQSLRWEQFQLLMSGGATMPEPGFANALYSQVTQTPDPCRAAVKWAQSPDATDLRQVALVADWCPPAQSGAQSAALAARLVAAMGRTPVSIADARDVAFAAIAAAEAKPDASAKALQAIVEKWWRGGLMPKLKAGGLMLNRRDVYPMLELMHVIRDNLNIEMRDDAPAFFKELPSVQLLSYYPTPYPAAENEYRIPFFTNDGDPDLVDAQLSRAADLAMIAYDTNQLEHQFLQGWVLQDRFLMRGALGIVYEFLWANPYQPGLSYHHMPNLFHDKRTGRLFVRCSWEEEATFFCLYEGQIQFFEEGKRRLLKVQPNQKPIEICGVTVMTSSPPLRFTVESTDENQHFFLVGLKPNTLYDIEADDQELLDDRTDAGGILALTFPGRRPGRRESMQEALVEAPAKGRPMVVRIKESPVNPPRPPAAPAK